MHYRYDSAVCRDYSVSSRLEWILTNGLGGFAMGTVAGSNTRRYHGHLVAAVRPPTDRMVLLATVEAYVTINGHTTGLSTNQYVGTVHPQGYSAMESFVAGDYVEWRFRVDGSVISKRLIMNPGENACTLSYRNLGEAPALLTLRPLVCHKFYHDNFRVTDFYPQFLVFPEESTILTHGDVKLALHHPGADRTPTTGWYYRFDHPRESERGLDSLDDLYCPCELRYMLGTGEQALLVASDSEASRAVHLPDEADEPQGTPLDMLCKAAKTYLVTTEERSTVIAGYPWFTDWGRDTMISLPGLCLETGRCQFAQDVLRNFAGAMEKGLIPNRFGDQGGRPEYNSADATLWFVNAIYLLLQKEWDSDFAREAFGWLQSVFEWHTKGTMYGIGVDPEDGLLRQGAPGVQLTWMDAKVGDWVVTPRHGKPVEVNGLWINALRVMEWLAGEIGEESTRFTASAALAEAHFEAKFWKETLGHYLDTVEPDDGSLRPNQLIAISLPFAPARSEKAAKALDKIRSELLTGFGLRTLAANQSGYRGRYEGPMAERDAAYHQGTAWPWLLGPYVCALLRVKGDVDGARQALSGVRDWLEWYGIGGIAEVADGDPPQNPGGCPWQAWSVAEVLRAWVETDRAESLGTAGKTSQ
ncbi:MAG: glycogen debranching enzyme family protein [Armatimonadetes bacterium]|nr:glycogen debranching enzyme family protein [Armatimonadota bacterium]